MWTNKQNLSEVGNKMQGQLGLLWLGTDYADI